MEYLIQLNKMNVLVKKSTSLIILGLISVVSLNAQTQQDLQKQIEMAKKQMAKMQSDPRIKEAMQQAQQAMDSMKSDQEFQKQMAQSKRQLDSMKKTNPALANMNIPDFNSIQMPNLDSISAGISKSSDFLQSMNKNMDESMPKSNPFNHAEKLSKLTNNDINILANTIVKEIKPKIDLVMQRVLDKMLKDTSINVAATGAFILGSGGSKMAAAFLICSGILRKPKDKWAINDLGVYFRDLRNYKKSLQCFFYANNLDSGHSKEIAVNIAWASAYYGDFDAATKYFDKALAIDPNYSSALEGEALLAYQKGDIKKLFECLAKEVTFIGGAGGGSDGPSDNFANVCGGAYANDVINTQDQNENPNDDHTFDNPNPDAGNSQDPPPGADVDPITYPMYQKIFIKDAKAIADVVVESHDLAQKSMQSINRLKEEIKQTIQKRKSLYAAPYTDNDGRLVYPRSFSKYVALFHTVEMQFERRCDWYTNKLVKKIDSYREQVVSIDGDMMKTYIDKLLACGDNDACVQKLNCVWIPKMYKSKQNDLDVVSKAWDDYYNNVAHTLQWFIDATAPFISRVHDEDWNEYLNKERELEVRTNILGAYGNWEYCIGSILTPIVYYIQQPAPACPATILMVRLADIPPKFNPPISAEAPTLVVA